MDRGTDFYAHYHYHKELQLTAFLEGEGSMMIGNHLHHFSIGDLLCIGENIPHLLQRSSSSKEDVIVLNVYFTKELFGLQLLAEGELKDLFLFLTQWEKGLLLAGANQLLAQLKQLKETESIVSKIGIILHVLDQIKSNKQKQWLNKFSYSFADEDLGQRLDAIYRFSLSNLHTSIRLEEVAKCANLSVSRFCRVFKKHTGKTYIQFLQGLRIETACSQLLHSEKNISEIAFQNGFINLSNFNKTFKAAKGEVPSAYRKRLKSFKNDNT